MRAYLGHRWRGSPLIDETEDAVQEVFLECFRQGGVLDRIFETRPASFRAFLYGVTRNVALRCERRIGRYRERVSAGELDCETQAADEATLSRVFDRSWARALFRQAGQLQEEKARAAGERARRRVELLRLRARESLPIREIARRWNAPAATVHKEYARAREEFRAALAAVISFHYPGSSSLEIEQKCLSLLELLQE